MTEPTIEPTPGSEPAATEPTAKEPEVKTFTEEDLNRIVKERLDRERKKTADYAELKAKAAKLEELENAKKTDEEKALAKLQALEAKIAAREKELADRNLLDLKRSKIEGLLAEKKISLPDGATIADVLDMVAGTSEEDLDTSKVVKLFPAKAESKAIGGGSQTPPAGKPPDLNEQIAALDAKLSDPNVTGQTRSNLLDQQLALMLKRDGIIKVS